MKAAVLREAHKPLVIETVSIDKPGPHEVLVRTMAAGVCRSDLHFINGSWPTTLPAVLGHESAGIVEMVGSEVRTVKVGDHVITCLTAYCGHCEECLTGHMALCASTEMQRGKEEPQRLSAPDGGPMSQYLQLSSFAEQMLIHEHALVAIRKDMPFDRAAIIGCGVTTGIGAVIHTAGVRPGETVAVIGCGGVGLAAINGAEIAGAGRIIAIDVVDGKANMAKHFGATDFINSTGIDVGKAVLQLTKGGVHHAFDCIGMKAATESAFRMLRRGGAATVVGMMPLGQTVEIPAHLFLGERRVQGCYMGSGRFPVDMPRYVDMYMAGRLKLDDMVSRRIKLEDINDAFDEMQKGEIARSVIVFEQ